MPQERQFPFHFQLHHCRDDGHYHFIIGEENISWPFWSRQAGVKLVEHSRNLFRKNAPPEELPFAMAEFDRIKSEIPDFRMSANYQPGEGEVAEGWRQFLTGETGCACFIAQTPVGAILVPLFCDFVGREDEKPTRPLTRNEMIVLAEKPATFRTFAEVGIVLERAPPLEKSSE